MKIIQAIIAVLWAFLGVRKKDSFNDDVKKLTPITVIAVGLGMGVLFVISLILIIKFVVLT